MASGFWKITVKWNQSPYGWSETWYMTASAIATAKTWLTTYLFARTNLMNTGPTTPFVQFVSASISDVNNKNVSQQYGVNDVGGAVSTYHSPGPNFYQDPTDAALRIYCVSASQKHRVFMMNALPQEVQNGNQFTAQPTWTAAFPAFQRSLTGTAGASTTIGQLKILDQTQIKYPLVQVSINPIVSTFMNATTVGKVSIVTAGGVLQDVVPGNRVLIRQVQPSIEVNRIWLVAQVLPNIPVAGQYTYVLGPHRTLGQINQNPSGAVSGYIRPVVYIGDNIVSVTQQAGVWKRDRGRVFGLPVGRRKVR